MAQTAEAKADLEVECSNCNAAPGERCTQPTDTSRREVAWTHSARHNKRIGWT